MDSSNRSRANHAVQYGCPEWTWPADELIHIREMSERTSVPASSLRYYEKLGLITSERETSGSQRRYSKATFYKIILITLAQSAGFNLEEIAEQLRNLPDIHPLPPKVWGPLHKLWERRIDQARRRASAIEDQFETLHARRLALSPLARGILRGSLAGFDPHVYSTSAVTLLGAHLLPPESARGFGSCVLLQLDKKRAGGGSGGIRGHSIHHPPRPVSYRLTALSSRRHGAEPVTRTKPQIRILRRLRSGINRLSSATRKGRARGRR